MSRFEASFDIDSKSDSHAVERMMDSLYDAVREEVRTTRSESVDSSALLDQFEAVREGARQRSRGTLTIVYEQYDGEFEETDE